MKQRIERIESSRPIGFAFSRDLFALVYTTVLILWSIPSLERYMDYPSKFCFVWGAGLILWDLLTKRRLFRSVFWGVPFLMVGAYCVTILLHREAGLYALAKHLVYLSLAFFLLFGHDRDASADSLKTLLRRICHVVIATSLVASAVSVGMYLFRWQYSFSLNELNIRQGFLENRLFGVYYSPNAGALFAVVSFAAVALNVYLYKDAHPGRRNLPVGLKIFYGVNIAFQTVYFSLTGSRGGLVTMMVLAVMTALFLVYPRVLVKKGRAKALVSCALALALATGGVWAAVKGVQTVMSYAPDLSKIVSEHEPVSEPTEPSSQEPSSEEPSSEEPSTGEPSTGEPVSEPTEPSEGKQSFDRIESGDDSSNGRFTIWKTSLKVLLGNDPVFGLGDFNLDGEKINRYPELRELPNDSVEKGWMWRHHGNLHNAYVQVAVYAGAVGLCIFLLLALLVFLKLFLTLLHGNPSSPYYPVIALLLALISTFAVNGVFESHLLFRGPNMFWGLFWTLTGIALLLCERFRASDSYAKPGEHDARFAFAVASPLQGLHAVNIASHDLEGTKGNADCYVCHMFTGAGDYAERLRGTGLFKNVYELDAFRIRKGAADKVFQLIRVLFPMLTLKRYAKGRLPLLKKSYGTVLMSNAIPFMSDLWLSYPGAEVWFFEDGVGSYFGDFSARSPLFRKIDNFFFNGTKSVRPTRMYLSSPTLSRSEMDCEILPLPALTDEETAKTAKEVFAYRDNDLYKTHRFVYLSQPFKGDRAEGYDEEADRNVLRLLSEVCGDGAILRLHPRDTAPEGAALPRDDLKNLWELECVAGITGGSVLIAAFSTSQFMPGILTGETPTLIFTYKLLFADRTKAPWPEAEAFIQGFGETYGGKIFCPDSAEELQSVLESLK